MSSLTPGPVSGRRLSASLKGKAGQLAQSSITIASQSAHHHHNKFSSHQHDTRRATTCFIIIYILLLLLHCFIIFIIIIISTFNIFTAVQVYCLSFQNIVNIISVIITFSSHHHSIFHVIGRLHSLTMGFRSMSVHRHRHLPLGSAWLPPHRLAVIFRHQLIIRGIINNSVIISWRA